MNKFLDLLSRDETILLDGAMGTMLMGKGLIAGEAPELWNVEHPQVVKEVHQDYIQAGSRVILTNTFGGNRIRLQKHNLELRVSELNEAAVKLALEAAAESGQEIAVAGSIGPIGELMKPLGKLTPDEARSAFAEQAKSLAKGGVDVLWIETMGDLNEVIAAIEGARSVSTLPVTATLSFDSHGRTMMGITPVQAIEKLKGYNLAALGANCGKGPDELEAAIQAMHEVAPEIKLIAKANAGIPTLVNGNLTYNGTPEIMEKHTQTVKQLGASLIGACCGSSPAHIKAMATFIE